MTVHLTHSWRCLGGPERPYVPCPEHGEGPGSDLAARKHLEATGHATCSFTTPKDAS